MSQAEIALLSALLVKPELVLQIDLEPEHFTMAAGRDAYTAIRDLQTQGRAVDVITLSERTGNPAFAGELMNSIGSPKNAEDYAARIRRTFELSELERIGKELASAARQRDSDPAELAAKVGTELAGLTRNAVSYDHDMGDLMRRLVDRLEARMESFATGKTVGVPFGFRRWDRTTGGMQPGRLYVIGGRPKMGKAQPLDAMIKTQSGWKRMGELEVGDALASVDGMPSKVLGVYPQGERQVYRVTFSDGRSTEACAEHLWLVHHRKWVEPRVLETREVAGLLGQEQYRGRLSVDLVSGDFGHFDELPVDPWLLGALIANGNLTNGTPRVSTKDAETLHNIVKRLPEGVRVRFVGRYDYRLSGEGRHNPLTLALQELGLMGKLSHEKRIPAVYLEAQRSCRLMLLRGLMDTDGWVEKNGTVRYSTSSPGLAEDVAHLVRSLGGLCRIQEKAAKYTYRGEHREGRTHYVCCIRHADPAQLIMLHRKQQRTQQLTGRQPRLNFVSIEPTRVVETQCIEVSHPTRLYVTDDFIVTHNTALAVSGILNAARRGYRIGFASAEMTADECADRFAAIAAQVDADRLNRGELSDDEGMRIAAASSELVKLPIRIFDMPAASPGAIARQARAWVLQNGLDLLVVDYLQRLKSDGKSDSRVREVGEMARAFKTLAGDLKVPVLLLAQLSRGLEQRQNKRPMMSDLRESGEIEQEADVIAFVYRDCVYNEEAPEDDAEILIQGNRHGPTGTIPMNFIAPRMLWCDADLPEERYL